MYRSAVILLWYTVLYVRWACIFSRSQYTVSLSWQLFLRPQLVHNNTTKSLISYCEHGIPGVTQSLTSSALYSRSSSNAGVGEVIIACWVKPRSAHFVWEKHVYMKADACGSPATSNAQIFGHEKFTFFGEGGPDVTSFRGGVRVTVRVYLNFSGFGRYFTHVFIYLQMRLAKTASGKPSWARG